MSSSVVVMSTASTQASAQWEASPMNPPLPDVVLSPEKMKLLYREDVQAEFLHLQAETDCLLQRLQSLQQARRQSTSPVVAPIGQTVSLC
ncbi:hypothetical protein [Trichothermofontia sp.]